MKKILPALAASFAILASTIPTNAALALEPQEKASRVVARADSGKVVAGKSLVIAVLKNDRLPMRTSARVKIVSTNPNLTIRVQNRQKVLVKAKASAPAGAYRFKYQVITKNGQKARALVTVRVTRLVPPPPPADQTLLQNRISALPVAPEYTSLPDSTPYDRDLFKHWNSGVNPSDSCDTRREVLVAEAVVKPSVTSSCAFTGGSWFSYYDGVTTADSGSFDIDHMIPLSQAWDSGAYKWDASTRERFANDLGDARSLVAVTASSNRSKGDKDPAKWMPAQENCRYLVEWVAVKTRWSLTVDQAEKDALVSKTASCGNPSVPVEKAPVS